ncbi:hypothetical protein quinque_000195 [Culex quinquefasciatus]
MFAVYRSYIGTIYDHSFQTDDSKPFREGVIRLLNLVHIVRDEWNINAAAAAEEASTVEELATPRMDEADVDRVAGGGRVDGGDVLTIPMNRRIRFRKPRW